MTGYIISKSHNDIFKGSDAINYIDVVKATLFICLTSMCTKTSLTNVMGLPTDSLR